MAMKMNKEDFDKLIQHLEDNEEFDRRQAQRESEKIRGTLVLEVDIHPDDLRELLHSEYITGHEWRGPLL